MNIYDFTLKDNKGNLVPLKQYEGKVLLIVNTATKCGFTPQYVELQRLYAKYEKAGLVILDFPCNQFLFQAPGSDEDIDKFVTSNYHTSFPRFSKLKVNGKEEAPLYHYLKEQKPGRIGWNFVKFLIDQKGNVIGRFDSKVTPLSLAPEIEKLLGPVKEEEKKDYPPVLPIKGYTLFSLVGCPHCALAKTALDKAKIPYTDYSYGDPLTHSTFHEYEIKQVPVLIYLENEKPVKLVGEDKIIAWIKEKK